MRNNNSYHEINMRKVKARLEEHLSLLPDFCTAFFRAKEDRLEPRTQCGYAEDLLIFFRYLAENNDTEPKKIRIEALKELNTQDIERFLKYITHYEWNGEEYHNSEAGKQRKLSSLRMLFRYLCKIEELDRDPTALVDMPKRHKKNIIILSKSKIGLLLDTIENGGKAEHYQQRAKLEKNRLRDMAIIMTLLGTGIRISELVGLNMSDVDFTDNKLNIIRKGGDEDSIYFGDDVENALKEYLFSEEHGSRATFSPGKDEPAVFISQQHRRITVRSVQKMVRIYADMAFGAGNRITPHKMRSTYGTTLYEETHDLELVSVALGHSSIETAKKHYVRFKEEQKKRAAIPVRK